MKSTGDLGMFREVMRLVIAGENWVIPAEVKITFANSVPYEMYCVAEEMLLARMIGGMPGCQMVGSSRIFLNARCLQGTISTLWVLLAQR